jgi:hypothetical protein
MYRIWPAILLGSLALVAGACGAHEPQPHAKYVPDVTGESLEDAKEELAAAGIAYDVDGGGTFGVVVDHFWRVCEQTPRGGERGRRVDLYVERECWQDS